MSWEVSTMRCGTSFFNATVYKSCLKRYWPVWAGLLLILILLLPLPILNAYDGEDVEDILRGLGGYGGIVLSFTFSIISAVTVFSWMYNARSTGFTAALPIRREGMFLSCGLAGFTMTAAPALAAAILIFLAAAGECGAAAAALAAEWLAKYLLLTLCFFGFACLCAQLTGTLWVLPVVYGLLNVAVAVMWLLISNILGLLLYGFGGDVPASALDLSPIVRIFTYDWAMAPFRDWWGLAAYAVFGILCAVLALLLAVRRRMESATDTVAVGWLKPVFRWVFAIGFALCFGSLLYLMLFENDRFGYLPMGIFLVLGAFIGWLIAEMLVRKSYKVASCLKTFPVLAVLFILLVVYCACGGFGYATRVPAPENVARAELTCGACYCQTEDPAEIGLIQQVHRKVGGAKPEDGGGLEIVYRLKNGGSMSRTYSAESLDEEDTAQLRRLVSLQRRRTLAEIAADREYTVSATGYGNLTEYGWFDLTEEQCRELITRGVLPDYDAGRLELVTEWPLGVPNPADDGYFELNLYSWKKGNGAYNDYRNRSHVLYISREATETWRLLEAYYEEWRIREELTESERQNEAAREAAKALGKSASIVQH